MPRRIHTYKICSKCKERKQIKFFSKSRTLDGIAAICKQCASYYQRKYSLTCELIALKETLTLGNRLVKVIDSELTSDDKINLIKRWIL